MTEPIDGTKAPRPRISAVMITLNEEQNIPYALRSVRPWVDEIIVVDMHSADRTAEIAREYDAKVYLHPKVMFFNSARPVAVAHATGDWILMLDADEMVPRALSEKLIEIARADRADVIGIPMVNYMLGAPMMHTRMDPWTNRHLRFFKPDALHLTDRVHKHIHPDASARVEYLPYVPGEAMVHFANFDCAHILDKINRFTAIEAEQSPDRGKAPSLLRVVARVSKDFYDHYVKARGYRDGWRGLYVSVATSLYVLLAEGKLFEFHENGNREAVRRLYQSEAEKIIMEYGAATRTTAHAH